ICDHLNMEPRSKIKTIAFLGDYLPRRCGIATFTTDVCTSVAAQFPEMQCLIGSYFVFEYSVESAALFNPSILVHPDQTGTPKGSLRFLMSLRSTGEGHISSVSFRSGVIDAKHRVSLDPASKFLSEPELIENPTYRKALFGRKIVEM